MQSQAGTAQADVMAQPGSAIVLGAVVDARAKLRTDLNRFHRDECELLLSHGYWSAHARFASPRPDVAVAAPSWRHYAGMIDAEAERLEHELTGGQRRRGLGEQLR
ncbi:MAG: hypothetical protein QOJ97_195 [Solirubrobacteraceae bacterium]|jgi:hypothetical protein|nr:hypothetical protein [Solirubrobacteraceae bacterium]